MTTTDDGLENATVREFDHNNEPAASKDQFGYFEKLRGDRVVWSPKHGGFWVLTEADDFRMVMRRPDLFSARTSGVPAMKPWPRRLIPMNVDPPEHLAFRQVLSPMFSPEAVEGWRDEARTCAGQLVDSFLEDGRCDVIWQFARIVPLRIFVLFMGLDEAESERWTRWHWELVRAEGGDKQRIGGQIAQMLTEVLEDRAGSPDGGDDIPRKLFRARLDGRTLTTEDVLDICYNLFIASLDTTAGSLAYSLLFLAQNDDHRRRLAGDLSLIPVAVEELLRWHPIVTANRTATADTDIAGVHVAAGDQIVLPTTLACRDPREFEDPLEFRLDRSPNHHLAFGAGPHRCLGSHLARMEMQVALKEWHRRIPEYRLPEGFEVGRSGGAIQKLDALELEWDVTTRLAD